MFIYKIDFFDKKSNLRFNNLNNFIQKLHRNNAKFYFAFNSSEFNGEVFIISKNEIKAGFFSNLEGVEKFSLILLKRFEMILPKLSFFIKNNNSSLNKSSIKKFILKNEDHLNKNSYKKFIESIGYDSPKKQHEIIYEEYKKEKDLDILLLNIQKRLKAKLKNKMFLEIDSLSTGQFFKIFMKEVKVKNIDILDFSESNTFGFVDKKKNF